MNEETTSATPDDTPIWRYMDLPKFLAMLISNSMWFAKAATLDDGYEGFCQVIEPDIPNDDHGPQWLDRRAAPGATRQINVERMVAEMGHMSAAYFQNASQHLYVNSWCLADESIAMWDLYGPKDSGVAIKSSIERYQRAIKMAIDPLHFEFGNVQYHRELESAPALQLDLRLGPIPCPGTSLWKRIVSLGFHKRICFQHEQEWRAALYQDQRDVLGCNIDFDLDELISRVYAAPRATNFFCDIVESVMERYGLRKPLEKSRLLERPRKSITTMA